MRYQTRRQRYEQKKKIAHEMPLSFVAINFQCDDNLAFLIRTAACYGAKEVCVIGSIPERSKIKRTSGGTIDYMKIRQFSNPRKFLSYVRENNISLISAELTDNSTSLYDFKFDFNNHTAIVLGHETVGVPNDILFNSKVLYIPMLGPGYCLNTSQAGTAFVTEYARQYHLSRI